MTEKTRGTADAVVVCGVHENEITEDGSGVQRFPTLDAARAVFPDLDPAHHSENFTAAMASHHPGEMRFETHQASRFYTARFPQRATYKRTWEKPAPPASPHD